METIRIKGIWVEKTRSSEAAAQLLASDDRVEGRFAIRRARFERARRIGNRIAVPNPLPGVRCYGGQGAPYRLRFKVGGETWEVSVWGSPFGLGLPCKLGDRLPGGYRLVGAPTPKVWEPPWKRKG